MAARTPLPAPPIDGRELREPRFLGGGRTAEPAAVAFPVVERPRRDVPERPRFATLIGRAPAAPAREVVEPPPPPPEPEPPPMAPPEPAGPGPEEFAERIAAAVSAMRLTSERLADSARADAVELALLLARRLVETELATSPEPLFALARSVLRRIGDSRRIVVRLCPADAERVSAAGGASKLLSGAAVASVEITADPALATGDCVVDADWGSVDARLEARYAELRRIVEEVLAAEEPKP
jgi:flagellar assembly protein FliH